MSTYFVFAQHSSFTYVSDQWAPWQVLSDLDLPWQELGFGTNNVLDVFFKGAYLMNMGFYFCAKNCNRASTFSVVTGFLIF